MEIFIGFASFVLGITVGFRLKSVLFTRLDWTLLKWDDSIFAYRPVQKGLTISKRDKVFMALRLPPHSLPKDGFKYE
tara:strand:- start:9954 stop:10184 length:231 start_codon:yes stop_codon:yes gene_type:complete